MVNERGHDEVRRHQEETVAATAESLVAFENAGLPLCVFSPDGDVIMANRAMRALLGYQFGELVGKSVFDVVAADRPDFTEAWKTRVRGDSSATPERPIALRRADGSELSVRVSSVLVRDTLGAPRYVVARAVCTQN